MKKILIVDGADKCSHCQFCYADQSWLDTTFLEETKFCAASKESRALTEYGKEDSPEWCPLKELPEKLSMDDYDEHVPEDLKKLLEYYNDGFNNCLTQILGEED